MLVSSHQPKMAHGKDPSKLSIFAIFPHCLSWVLHLKSLHMIAIMTQTASIKLVLKTCSTKNPSTSNSTEPFPRLHHMDRWWRWPSSQMWPDICKQVNRLKTWLVVDHGLESVTESRSKVLLGGWNFTTSPTKKNLPRQIHGFSCWGRGGEGKWYETQTGTNETHSKRRAVRTNLYKVKFKVTALKILKYGSAPLVSVIECWWFRHPQYDSATFQRYWAVLYFKSSTGANPKFYWDVVRKGNDQNTRKNKNTCHPPHNQG